MRLHTLAILLPLFVSLSRLCAAEETVFGPPTLIVNARIDSERPLGGTRLVGTVLDWSEIRQSWNQNQESDQRRRTTRSSTGRTRAVIVLQAKQFVASVTALRFSRLNGDAVDASDVPNLLQEKRAIAFVRMGCAIHPAIAMALHPDTLIVTRVTYPDDPVVIPLPEAR